MLPSRGALKTGRKLFNQICCYRTCKSNARKPTDGLTFFQFAQPCKDFRKEQIARILKQPTDEHLITDCPQCSKVVRWINLCDRKDDGLRDVSDVKQHTYICNKHFVEPGVSGPSEANPDPILPNLTDDTEDESQQKCKKRLVRKKIDNDVSSNESGRLSRTAEFGNENENQVNCSREDASLTVENVTESATNENPKVIVKRTIAKKNVGRKSKISAVTVESDRPEHPTNEENVLVEEIILESCTNEIERQMKRKVRQNKIRINVVPKKSKSPSTIANQQNENDVQVAPIIEAHFYVENILEPSSYWNDLESFCKCYFGSDWLINYKDNAATFVKLSSKFQATLQIIVNYEDGIFFPSVSVFGKELQLWVVGIRNKLSTLADVANMLAILENKKLCRGITDENYSKIRISDSSKSNNSEKFIHSKKCHLLSDFDCCEECSKYISTLQAKLEKISTKASLKPINKFCNYKFMGSEALHDRLRQCKLQLKIAQKSVKRKNEKIKQLRGQLRQTPLERTFNEFKCDENGTGSIIHVLLQSQVDASKRKSMHGYQWHPDIIQWCLHLQKQAPAAYKTITNGGLLVLPSVSKLNSFNKDLNK